MRIGVRCEVFACLPCRLSTRRAVRAPPRLRGAPLCPFPPLRSRMLHAPPSLFHAPSVLYGHPCSAFAYTALFAWRTSVAVALCACRFVSHGACRSCALRAVPFPPLISHLRLCGAPLYAFLPLLFPHPPCRALRVLMRCSCIRFPFCAVWPPPSLLICTTYRGPALMRFAAGCAASARAEATKRRKERISRPLRLFYANRAYKVMLSEKNGLPLPNPCLDRLRHGMIRASGLHYLCRV